jgi:hypothetical protein
MSSEKNGHVIVTCPAWASQSSPLGASLARLSEKYLVNVIQSPIMDLEMVNDADRRAILRELNEWDEIKADHAITVVCSTPEAPEALEQFDELCIALQLRADRLKFAAIDQETAISLSEVCHLKDIGKFHYSSVMTPETPGSLKELTDLIVKREEERELCLIFEPAESSGLIGKTLISNGLRVIRMGFYKYRLKQVAAIPQTDTQKWWVVLNDALSVPEIAKGLKRHNVNFSNVRWMGCRPSIGKAVRKILPKAEFLEVSELRPDIVLDAIQNHIVPAKTNNSISDQPSESLASSAGSSPTVNKNPRGRIG